jgi:hypothetical protein
MVGSSVRTPSRCLAVGDGCALVRRSRNRRGIVSAGTLKNDARDIVLHVWRKVAHCFERLVEELCDAANILRFSEMMK